MKAGLLCLAGLSAVAFAQPHRRHRHQKRAVVVDMVTEVEVATATAAQAIVYVDQNGKPTATSYLTESAAATPTSSLKVAEHYHSPEGYHHESSSTSSSVYVAPTTSAASSSPSVYVAPTPSSTSSSVYITPTTSSTSVYVAPTTYAASSTSEASSSAPAPVTYSESSSSAATPTTYSETSSSAAAPTTYAESSSTASAPASYSSGSLASDSGRGVTYSPYKADNTCKSTEEVATDFEKLGEFSVVRLYGTDCNQVANVLAAMPTGMKLFAGVYQIDSDSLAKEIEIIYEAVNGDWSSIDTISIGNELVNSGTNTVAEVASAVSSATTTLRGAPYNYNGPIVTVDTVGKIVNPLDSMCDIGDYVAANCHAFFDADMDASGAGEWVLSQVEIVSSFCGGKKTVITESGWPSQGENNGVAVPSLDNQEAAISSLKSTFSNNIFLFNAYNDLWKSPTTQGTFGAEQYWGIFGDSAAN